MSSKQPCAVSQCANNAAAGKLYCIFHRQHNAQPSGEFAPSGAVAAAATSPAVAGPRVPPPPPPPQQQQQSATVAASAVSAGPPSLPVQPLRVPPPPPPAQSANSATPPSLPPNRTAPPPPPPPPAQPSASSTPSYASSPSATPPALPAASTPSPISSASSASFVSPAVPLARGDSQPQPQSQNQRKSLGARFSSFTDSVKAKVESATSKSSPSPGKTSSPVVISSPGSSVGSPGSYGYGSGGGGGSGNSGRVAPAPPTIASLRPPPVLPSQPSHHHHSSSSSFGGSGSGSMGGEVIGIGSATAVRSGVPSISYTRLPSSSRFSLSSTVVPSFGAAVAGSQGSPGPSPSPNAGLGGTLDLSSLRTLQFQHLTHVPEVLSAQVDTGLYAVHRMVAVWRRTLALEEEHWRAHIRAYEHEAGKDRVDLDGAEITLGVWSAFQRYQVELAQVHLDFTQRLTIHALVPLLEFHPAAVLKKKELDRDVLAREREFHSSRVGVNKELQKCSSLMETWSRLKDEEEGAGAGSASAGAGASAPGGGGSGASGGSQQHSSSGGSGSSGGSNLFSKLGAQLSSRISTLQFSSSASVLEKLGPAAAKYAELLQAHNRRAEIFLTHELPAYLHELQRLEVQRLELAAACMAAWAALSEERSAAVHAHFFHAAPASAGEESSGALPRAIASLNPEADLEGTLSTLVASHGLAPSWAPQTWGLAVGLEDIRAGRVRSNAGGVFHVSLAQQMAAQQASHPWLPVPRFMLYTLSAIRSAGLGAEGVFRISPNKDEMDALKKRLQGAGSSGLGRDHFPAGNVFLACALLKEWLRSLSDGVVPCRDYNSAIAIVKGTGAGAGAGDGASSSSAAAAAASSAEQQSSAVLSLLSTLPPVNQAVLALLADLSAEILEPAVQASNKMTIEALAIVLAPGLMRSSSEDPMELLQNAKHEIKFVALVLRTMIHAAQQRKGKSQLVTLLEGLQ